jgi:hypothetical protein
MKIFDFDPKKVRELFEHLYGKDRGRRRFRTFLTFAILAGSLLLIAQITGSINSIVSTVHGWFTQAPTPPAQPRVTINAPSINTINQSGGSNTIVNQAPPARRLSSDQSEKFIAVAKGFCSPGVQVNATADNGNHEAKNYAQDFVSALRKASCKADLALPIPGLKSDIVGVHVGIRTRIEAEVPQAAKGLMAALNAGGVSAGFGLLDDDFLSGEQFVLVIGSDQ